MILKYIEIQSKDDLIYEQGDFLDPKGHLTKNGAENFLGILSTLLLNYTSEKKPEWLVERFELVLEKRFSLVSSFRNFMMSLLDHSPIKEEKDEIVKNLTKIKFGKGVLLHEPLHVWIDENVIDEISFYRTFELGKLLIKDASMFLGLNSIVGMQSSSEILRKVPKNVFEHKMMDALEKKIPGDSKANILMKTFLFHCLLYSYNPIKFPESLMLNFAFDVKPNLFFYENVFEIMKRHHQGIIRDLHKEMGRNRDKGLNL